MKVAVLGGYGLIGAACVRALKAAGHQVIGVGRSHRHAMRADPDIEWFLTDIGQTAIATWQSQLSDVDVVINASGLLQGGAELRAIHVDTLTNLTQALAGTDTHLIHISAAGVSPNASTAFFRTKAEGDAIIQASDFRWTILRPTLVLAPQAYGGTALLRAAAAFPMVEPRIFPETPLQSIHIDDLTTAVLACAEGEIPPQEIYDLTEPDSHPFATVVRKLRRWQGLPDWRGTFPVPTFAARLIGWAADMAGGFGWRSPFRTTALKVMQTGVSGDPTHWVKNGGTPARPLDKTLATLPSTTQERWFARLFLLLPVGILGLSAFWIATGLITLADPNAAVTVLTSRGFAEPFAQVATFGGSGLDLLLGIAILFRRSARLACLGMAALSLVYLILGTFTAPDLWADPLGPFVKILPAMLLPLFVAAILEER